MLYIVAIAALVIAMIAYDKGWGKIKVLCYFIGLFCFIWKAIWLWVYLLGSVM